MTFEVVVSKSGIKVDDGYTFFPFNDGQCILTHNGATLLKCESSYNLSISPYCEVGQIIVNLFEKYHCNCTLTGEDARIILHNPNGHCNNMMYTLTGSLAIYFEGLYVNTDHSIIRFHLI